jgi:hypothetical protein
MIARVLLAHLHREEEHVLQIGWWVGYYEMGRIAR